MIAQLMAGRRQGPNDTFRLPDRLPDRWRLKGLSIVKLRESLSQKG